MDVALTNSIVNTATNLASAKTSDALNMVVPVSYTHLTLPTTPYV